MKVKSLILCGLAALFFVGAHAQPPCYTIDTSRPEWLAAPAQFSRGDADNDGAINISDVAYLLNYLFKGSSPPDCMDAGDANDDGVVDVADAMHLLNYLFRGGPTPPSPCCDLPADCGPDPTPDALNCLTHVCMTGVTTTRARPEKPGRESRVVIGEAQPVDHELVVPVYVTASQPLSVFSYAISYDPTELAAVSVDNSALVSEEFDFFSGWIDDEVGQIRVGNVVSLTMAETLPPGTHKVANIVFRSLSLIHRFTRDLPLSVAEAIFAESTVGQKPQFDDRKADLPTREVPFGPKGTTEIVFPPDGTTFELCSGETFELDVTAVCTTPGCSVCVWAGALPLGASFPLQCLLDSVTSTFTWTPADSQTGTYTIAFYAAPDKCHPQDTCLVQIIVGECADLGDTAISDHHEDFGDRGNTNYQDVVDDFGPEVNVVYGNLVYIRNDVLIRGAGLPMEISFTYNSGSFFNGRYGYGWQMNRNLRYVTNCINGNVIIVRNDDRTDIFVKQPDGSFKATYGVRDSLSQEPTGYKLTTKHGIEYYFDSPDHHYMTKMKDPNGDSLVFTYNADKQLTTATDHCGREIDFDYNEYNKLVKLTDLAGREWHYHYDGDDLMSVTNPLGHVTSYTYSVDGCHDITSITTARGDVLSITYNCDYQVQEMATSCGDIMTFSYDRPNKRTVITDGKGNSTVYTYDQNDRVVAITDAAGFSTIRTWDDDYNLTSIAHCKGDTTRYTYDSRGNVLTEVNALGDTTWYSWHPVFNKMTMRIDATHDTSTFDYDSFGNLTKEKNDLGDSTLYWYGGHGQLDSTMNARGYKTHYRYDLCGNRILRVDALSDTTFHSYDLLGNLLSTTDANHHTTAYRYDPLNRLMTTATALGCSTIYHYDAVGNDSVVFNANGNPTEFRYDCLNRMIMTIDAQGCTTSYAYDGAGNRSKVVDANGKVICYEYDEMNRLIQMIKKVEDTDCVPDADDVVTSYRYDCAGNRTSVTDPNGDTSTYTYDVLNRLISETNPEGETIYSTYDEVGNRDTVRTPNGNVAVYQYDKMDRLISITDLIGPVAHYTHDEVGNRVTSTDGNGNTTSYTYDELGRMVKVTIPSADSTMYTYDKVGNLLSVRDRNGNLSSYIYDELDRKICSIDALGDSTKYSYDCMGNRLSIVDAEGNPTNYTYDALNRLIQETYADSTTRLFDYDCVGNILWRKDNNGDTTYYVYDDLYYLIKRDYPDDPIHNPAGDDTFAYDRGGRMLTASNLNSTVSYTYDGVGRVLSETLNAKTTGYSYDIPGRKRILIYPSGKQIIENMDLRSRLDNVKNGALRTIVQYSYDLGNRVTSRNYLNGTSAAYDYNDNNWAIGISYRKGMNEFAGFEYGFDKEGNRQYQKKLHHLTNSEQYVYDDAYQLTTYREGTLGVTGNIPAPICSMSFAYDHVANRLSVVDNCDTTPSPYVPNNMHEYDLIAGIPQIYDDNGNLTCNGIDSLAYDYENRLIRVIRESDQEIIAQYKYDPLGRRTEKNVGGTVAKFFFDGARKIEERNAADSVLASYVYGDWIDEVLTMERGGQSYYFHQQSLGSIAALTDSSGAVLERYEYDGYGRATISDSSYSFRDSSFIGNPYSFTGREYDLETGLYYYRARYYDPVTGRFIQRDPLEYVDGMNRYAYGGNNPVNAGDPTGLGDLTLFPVYVGDFDEKAKDAVDKSGIIHWRVLDVNRIDNIDEFFGDIPEAFELGYGLDFTWEYEEGYWNPFKTARTADIQVTKFTQELKESKKWEKSKLTIERGKGYEDWYTAEVGGEITIKKCFGVKGKLVKGKKEMCEETVKLETENLFRNKWLIKANIWVCYYSSHGKGRIACDWLLKVELGEWHTVDDDQEKDWDQ